MAVEAGAAYRPGEGVLLLAEGGDGVVGWLEGVLDGAYPGPGAPVGPPHGYIQTVVVAASWRGAGVGRALVEEFVAAAAASRLEWVFAAPDEGPGVEGRVAWLARCGFADGR
ncbi:GNAT family N-acetyltransferase [Nocardiopsis sp. NRRL B-16309]|uniref:GNAT family N-acetyltransferase n=1 Tax=Nocardiopsis sp. NRRL B-16309 TaxID=1519494 RepID=UPI0018D00782|nr:GNAT family N-acetyltransferase [Nocardiopsis sp. NRRL B-16309]